MRETGIARSAISEMTLGKRRPYMDQAFLLARSLDVTSDYLADDNQGWPPPKAELSDDERVVIGIIRALKLTTDETIRRLYGAPADGGSTNSVPATAPKPGARKR